MSYTGGDLQELKIDHEVVGSKTFAAYGDEEWTFDLGGVRKSDDGAIATNGRKINKMNTMPWMLKGVIAWDMLNDEELEYLTNIAADPNPASITATHISGAVYTGSGSIVGEVVGNTKDSKIELTLSGGGKLEKI